MDEIHALGACKDLVDVGIQPVHDRRIGFGWRQHELLQMWIAQGPIPGQLQAHTQSKHVCVR